jgi:hypothetical protein
MRVVTILLAVLAAVPALAGQPDNAQNNNNNKYVPYSMSDGSNVRPVGKATRIA